MATGFESDGYSSDLLESGFSDGSFIEEDLVVVEDGKEARERILIQRMVSFVVLVCLI